MSVHFSCPLVQASSGRRDRRLASAFTLVEILVAMAVTLILIAALAQAFAVVGETVSQGRAAIELMGNMRGVAHRLQQDLQGVTVPVRPWADDAGAQGYFEYFDGPSTDKDWDSDGTYDTDATASLTTLGDVDDVVAFTTQDAQSSFSGVVSGSPRESPVAEVIWWIQESGGKRVVFRRVLLVLPELGAVQSMGPMPNTPASYLLLQQGIASFFQQNDISAGVRWWLEDPSRSPPIVRLDDPSVNINAPNLEVRVEFRANSLADLTRRENRFAHRNPFPNWEGATSNRPPYPFPMNLDAAAVDSLYRMGRPQDLTVYDALAFDAQAFDPTARIYSDSSTNEALVPSDPGYIDAASATGAIPVAYGAFVDVGYGTREIASKGFNAASWSVFSDNPTSLSRLFTYTYCTWSTHYERDGANQDDDSDSSGTWDNLDYYQGTPRDEGTDGFDTNLANGVDDVGERETCPPYPSPLRGLQVRIRAWDPDSRQVRQASVIQDFIPE